MDTIEDGYKAFRRKCGGSEKARHAYYLASLRLLEQMRAAVLSGEAERVFDVLMDTDAEIAEYRQRNREAARV